MDVIICEVFFLKERIKLLVLEYTLSFPSNPRIWNGGGCLAHLCFHHRGAVIEVGGGGDKSLTNIPASDEEKMLFLSEHE